MTLSIGQPVRHKLSGESMKVKKLYGSVASCILDTPRLITRNGWQFNSYVDIAVCSTENLIPDSGQQSIF